MSDIPSLTLDALAYQPLWVAWQEEIPPDSDRPTKVPYRPGGKAKASSTDPTTWGTRDSAATRAATLPMPHGMGGVGINMASLDNGLHLVGVDLDTCVETDGSIAPWAQQIVERFASYAEVSPSGTGIKIFFLVTAEDRDLILADIHAIRGSNQEGIKWARGNERAHPPAIELFLGKRYFTVTEQHLGGTPEELRVVAIDDLRWLIRTAGPAFKSNGADGQHDGGTRKPRDESRSGAAWRLAVAMHRDNKTFEEFRDAVRDNLETASWYREKGTANNQRELNRAWDNAQPPPGPPWLVSLGAPYDTARLLIRIQFTTDGMATLHRHRGGFYAWNDTAYGEVTDAEIRAQAYAFLDQCIMRVKDAAAPVRVKPNTRTVNDLLDSLRAAALLPDAIEAPAWLNGEGDGTDPADIIACENGLLHLPTLKLLSHTPAFYTHNALDYAYDPAAIASPAWIEFLHQLWPDDRESIEALQEIFGYFLVADTAQQKAFLLVGPKRSGKGTIARVLTNLVGVENTVSPTLAALGTNFGLQPLIGKRVAIISDARISGRADQAVIAERLLSITGEDSLTIDRKYRESWTGRLGTRFLVLTNELPKLTDESGALASRLIVLVLTESFYGREDLGLINKLLPELPGILNWAIQGWRRLRQRGHFVQPASAAEALQELENLSSPVGAFVREQCLHGKPEYEVTVNDIFLAWESWCSDQRRQHTGDKTTFGRNLRAAIPGIAIKRRRLPNREGVERYYQGIRLKGDPSVAGEFEDDISFFGDRF